MYFCISCATLLTTVQDEVLRWGDGPESFLACRVPDLQFDALPVNVHRADLEVHTDSGDVASCRTAAHREQDEVTPRYESQTSFKLNQVCSSFASTPLQLGNTSTTVCDRSIVLRAGSSWKDRALLTRKGVVCKTEQKAAFSHIWEEQERHEIQSISFYVSVILPKFQTAIMWCNLYLDIQDHILE